MANRGIGRRVAVWSGDGSEALGNGTYVDQVTVYVIPSPGGLSSYKCAEERPDLPNVEKIERNPKIRLDSGGIVYGCQVWWDLI